MLSLSPPPVFTSINKMAPDRGRVAQLTQQVNFLLQDREPRTASSAAHLGEESCPFPCFIPQFLTQSSTVQMLFTM